MTAANLLHVACMTELVLGLQHGASTLHNGWPPLKSVSPLVHIIFTPPSAGKCPLGNAWADVAAGDDVAHQPAECSNRGHCNTKTGQCECMPGYEGLACNRSTLCVSVRSKRNCHDALPPILHFSNQLPCGQLINASV